MADIVVETQRLILRTEAPGDFEFWLQHMNTPDVMRHLGGVREPHEIEAMFAQSAAGLARDGFGFWILQMKSDGTPIGKAGLSPIETKAAPARLQGAVQIGWSLRADYWRRGLAMEAAVAVLEHGFSRLGLTEIFGQTSENNIASWRMMEKMDMRRCGALDYVDPDYPPEENPTIIYSIKKLSFRG
jgi:RimJ/RimL family protein N-acetyltransferase